MLFENVYIESTASFIPDHYELVTDAVAQGKIKANEAAVLGFKQLSIAESEFKKMCEVVAKYSLADSEGYEENLISIYLSYTHWHGNRYFWSPSAYLQSVLNIKTDCSAYLVQQGCNGMSAAIEQASLKICASNYIVRSLVVGADKFSNTNFNRWNSDIGLVYGDGAAAVVLTNKETPIEIISINTITESSLEILHRDNQEKDVNLEEMNNLFMIRDTKVLGLVKLGANYLTEKTQIIVKKLINKTLQEANINLDNNVFAILPNLGELILNNAYRVSLDKTIIEIGQDLQELTGHLGTTDTIVKLDRVLKNNKPDLSKKYVLLISAGSGFSWSVILLKFK